MMANDDEGHAPDGRRVRGARTRRAMIDAATSLFSTRGYAGTGISEIARRAGVNSGSIYHAFGNKEGLLDAVMHTVADTMITSVETLPHQENATAAERLDAAARILVGDPVFLRLFLLLALEQDENPTVRATVESVRRRARDVVIAAIEPSLDAIPAARRPAAATAVGRIALILLDGIFVSHQLDSEADDLDATLALVTMMVELAIERLPTLLADPDSSPPTSHHLENP
ncbi:TetR/AcrR family transcriptional regulator [Rhodococcus sp. NBC_00297]|uniref:TetR/AcrR family transcriptional regulator n=1 Tax=Rhodococcus sp. NBC_00297 TaxID=2976005 RepID=UPI002E2A22E7|nr:helix-turn-helix domain-containing protein [Rhodococcus sp. NBC_00297]